MPLQFLGSDFPNHLSIESQFVLLALEHASGGNNTKSILDSMASFVTAGTTHLTADFYAFYLAALRLVGSSARPSARVAPGTATIPTSVATGLLQGLLLDFQAEPIMNRAVNLTLASLVALADALGVEVQTLFATDVGGEAVEPDASKTAKPESVLG